ncbi:MAG: glycine cleavage T C-terminal barrel domain-containing protein [Acidobacteriota bacterium]|nr:MAG: glycine cleavage T C-terminal barrel domain-containing protein [Acidobacteriota bacterium]
MDDVGKVEPASRIISFFGSPSEDFETQYRAAMEASVVIDRSHLVRIAARGADRTAFLHNMLSADIKNLAPGAGTEAAFLTNKGKLVANLTVFHDDDRLLMEVESGNVSALFERLSRYIISEDVTLESLVSDEALFSIEGPGASELVAQLTGASTSELDELAHLGVSSSDGVWIAARHHDPSRRFDVAAPQNKLLELLEKAREHGAVIGSWALAETRRIEAGRPRFGTDMDETHMPLEAGLDEAINFDKGCYIGQEYVVRLAHRGHLNRKLVGIKVAVDRGRPDVPAAGSAVTAGDKDAGSLTSAAYSPTLDAIVALGFLRREFFEPGTQLTIDGKTGIVTPLPFV